MCSDKISAKINIIMHFLHHEGEFLNVKDHQLSAGLVTQTSYRRYRGLTPGPHWGVILTPCVCRVQQIP